MSESWQPSAEQREILQLNAGRHLVLAPPGTGKTELLAHRVRDALLSGIPPERILCLTFTVRAAEEMKARIRAAVPRGRLPELGNFHHWCHKFLFSRKLVPGGWEVADEALQADLLRETLGALAGGSPGLARRIDALRDRAGNLPLDALASHAAHLRQRDLHFPAAVLRAPRDGAPSAGAADSALLRRIADAYRARKEALRLLDFDDLLLYAYWFVAIRKTVPEAEKCVWVQIDEVQDLNPLQWGLVRALSTPRAHQVFFGDGEQSIFSFLGADRGNLARVAATCDAVHTLARNYRSRSYLLDLTVRYALKTLHADWDALPEPGTVAPPPRGALHLADIPRGTAQEDWLAARLRRAWDAAAASPRPSAAFPRTAILVRTNRRADDFESALLAAGLPVYKVAGADWSARPEARDFKALLSVLAKPGDRMSWARLFRLFGAAPTPAAARDWASALFAAGLRPADLLAPDAPHPSDTPLDALHRSVAAPSRTVVFDTETTGTDPTDGDIVQLAALELIDGVPARAFNRYLRTDRDLSATEPIHHISRDFLDVHGEEPAGVLRDFIAFADGAPLAGHNVGFDRAFLSNALSRHGLPPLPRATEFIDTLDWSRRLFPALKSHRLGALVEAFDLAGANTHNAADDVEATAHLLLHLAATARDRAAAQRDFLRGQSGAIARFRAAFLPLWTALTAHPGRRSTFRRAWSAFLGAALDAAPPTDPGARSALDAAATKFLRYTDHAFGGECKNRPFLEVVRREAQFLARFKEVDLLVGDEPIVVSTVHRAKGLEFPRVVVPDAQDGAYPGPFDRTDADRHESARILYVAMTRARDRLLLLSTGAPSPFLSPVLECFQPGRPDLYARLLGTGRRWLERLRLRAPRPAGTATDPDWLARYYYLSAARASRTVPPGLPALLDDPDPTVRDRARTLLAAFPTLPPAPPPQAPPAARPDIFQ